VSLQGLSDVLPGNRPAQPADLADYDFESLQFF